MKPTQLTAEGVNNLEKYNEIQDARRRLKLAFDALLVAHETLGGQRTPKEMAAMDVRAICDLPHADLLAAAGMVIRESSRTDSETCLSARANRLLNDAFIAAGGKI